MKERLGGRDFITLGIFNAIAITLYMIIGFVLSMTVIGGLIAQGIALGVVAPVYLLMGIKINKKGVFTVSGILMGLIGLTSGHISYMVFSIIAGIVCDFIIGDYRNKLKIVVGYGFYSLLNFMGPVFPVLFFGTKGFLKTAKKWNMSTEQIKQALSYFTVPWTIFFGVLTFIIGCIGAYLSIKLLNKHFKKAGVI